MQIVVVATMPNGDRVEGTLTFPDTISDEVMATGNAKERTRIKLQQAVEVAAENAFVAARDYKAERARRIAARQRRAAGVAEPPRGPDQVAFAGSTEPAVPVPGTGTHSHEDALRLAGFEERFDPNANRIRAFRLDAKE